MHIENMGLQLHSNHDWKCTHKEVPIVVQRSLLLGLHTECRRTILFYKVNVSHPPLHLSQVPRWVREEGFGVFWTMSNVV